MEATKSTMITGTKSTADKSTVVDMDPTEENNMVVDTDPMVVGTVVNSMEVNDTEVNNTEVNSTAYTTKDTKNTVKTSTVPTERLPALTTSIIQRPILMLHKPLLNTTTKTS